MCLNRCLLECFPRMKTNMKTCFRFCSIYSHVPTVHGEAEVECPSTGEFLHTEVVDHHKILLGGDLLTSFRVRGVQRLMRYSDNVDLQCSGLIPISEDWHTKMNLLEVNSIIINTGLTSCLYYVYVHHLPL